MMNSIALLLLAVQAAPATASFKFNGKDARMAPTGKNDGDPPNGSLQKANDRLTLTIYGGDPGLPKRGMLSFFVENFKPEAGVLEISSASFHHYLDAAGTKIITYACKMGAFKLTLTKCEKGAAELLGQTYIVEGTFSGDLDINEFQPETALKKISFSEGKFSGLVVQSIGKKRKE